MSGETSSFSDPYPSASSLSASLLVGTDIRKRFSDRVYNGVVDGYNKRSKLLHVTYSDGDSEELDEEEVGSLLYDMTQPVTPAGVRVPRKSMHPLYVVKLNRKRDREEEAAELADRRPSPPFRPSTSPFAKRGAAPAAKGKGKAKISEGATGAEDDGGPTCAFC